MISYDISCSKSRRRKPCADTVHCIKPSADKVHCINIQSYSLKFHVVVTFVECNNINIIRLMGRDITALKKGCSDSEVQTDIGASYEEMQEAHDFFCLVSYT